MQTTQGVSQRITPHNIELEQQIIGAILNDNDLYHRIGSIVTSEHFFDPVHADIFRRAVERIERDHVASAVSLKADMDSHAGLAELGGVRYLARMAGGAVASHAIVDYALELVELHRRRQMLGTFKVVADGFHAGELTADKAVAELELLVAEQEESREEPRSMSLLKAHTRSLTLMNEAMQGGEHGIPTGIADLDHRLPLRMKRYTILAGSTSMGKTGSAISIAKNAAERGYGVGFASLEMSEEDLANRINSMDSGIPYKAYDQPMSEASFRKVQAILIVDRHGGDGCCHRDSDRGLVEGELGRLSGAAHVARFQRRECHRGHSPPSREPASRADPRPVQLHRDRAARLRHLVPDGRGRPTDRW